MKEFDFEELDKAVSSLMGNVKKPEDTPDAAPASLPTPAEPAATPVADTPSSEPLAISEEERQPEPVVPQVTSQPPASPSVAVSPVVARRGGRFMDVVHQSSDMKTVPAAAAPSREGVTLQPTARATSQTPSAPVMDMITPATKRPTPQPVAPVVPTEVPETESPSEDDVPPNEPWTSPFLPDTQVEKRPLGGSPSTSETGLSNAIAEELSKAQPTEDAPFDPLTDTEQKKPHGLSESESVVEDTSVEADDEPAAEEAEDDLQLAPQPTDAPLPAELNNDLVAIESGQKTTTTEEMHTPAAPVDSPESTTSIASAALSTSSISPQYNEQPSTGDTSHVPIYDSEAMHQPLAHPPKKKKGLLIIIMIVLMVVLGGGLGVLAYFLGLL